MARYLYYARGFNIHPLELMTSKRSNNTLASSVVEGSIAHRSCDSGVQASDTVEQRDLYRHAGSVFGRFTLTFADELDERAYAKYFLKYNVSKWCYGLAIIAAVGTVMYIYSMAKSAQDALLFQKWRRGYDPDALSKCPSGYFCSECLPSICQSEFNFGYEMGFYVCGIILPVLVAYVLSRVLQQATMAWYIHHISAVTLLLSGLISIILRFQFMSPKSQIYVEALLLSGFLFAYYGLMQVRFIFASISIFILIVLFPILNIIKAKPHQNDIDAGISTSTPEFITSIYLTVIAVVTCLRCYEMEAFYRRQFQSTLKLQNTNNKLNLQLKNIQKSYQMNLRNFDSPLERSIIALRSCLADPGINPRLSMKLGHILGLLSANNLLTPDMENIITEKGVRIDNEQEAWLFSEVVRRRGDIKRRGSIAPRYGSTEIIPGTHPSAPLQPTRCLESLPPDNQRGLEVSQQQHQPLRTVPMSITKINEIYEVDNEILAAFESLLCKYDFPIFDYVTATQNRPLSCLMVQLFRRHDLFQIFQIPMDKFWRFITIIENGYHPDLPYHNRVHAADVLQTISYLANMSQISNILSDADLLAVFIAAAIHDYDHPGLNNNYLIATNDQRAILYNDKSVLENHHLSASFSILWNENNNFLSHFSRAHYRVLRETVVEMVLATDLSQHLSINTMFKNRATQGNFDPNNSHDDRIILLKMLMKLADVGNPTKAWSLYERWYLLILEEFFQQGDTERQAGLDVSPFMDREKVNIPSNQLSFIDFIVSPLFGAFHLWAPIPSIINSLAVNRDIWLQRKLQQPSTTDIAPLPAITMILNVPEELEAPKFVSTSHGLLPQSFNS